MFRASRSDGATSTRDAADAAPVVARTAARNERTLKIASYNVNGVNGRLPHLLEWLASESPDVACLQEFKTDDRKFPARAIETAGYGAVWHGPRSHHGVAILARDETPKERRRGLPGDASERQARYLEVEAKGFVVASIYLPNGNPCPSPNFTYKLRWFGRLIGHAKELYGSRRPVVLGGDLNVVPTDLDIYNPSWWRFDAVMQPETRAAYRMLLAQGWTDAARHLHEAEPQYTYWVNEHAFRRNNGFRLDFLLCNAAARGTLRATGVDVRFRDGVRPSDHAPVWITVASPRQRAA